MEKSKSKKLKNKDTSKQNSTLQMKERLCLKGLKVKEDGTITGMVATTHPDRVGDIISVNALNQIADHINDTSSSGQMEGAFRSVSLFHDWIHESDPTRDEAGFVKPGSAKLVPLDDGHFGVEVEAEVNKYYNSSYEGNQYDAERINYEIEKGKIAGFSIEYNTDDDHSKKIIHNGEEYRFIEEFTEYGGQAFARARMIANPHAVIYKEIENQIKESKEEVKMSEEVKEESKPEPEVKEKEVKEEESKPVVKESKPEVKEEPAKAKEELTPEIKEEIEKEIKIKSKIIKTTKEDKQMEEVSLSVKEMKEALNKNDVPSFNRSASLYMKEHDELFKEQYMSSGIVLKPTTIQVKCIDNKLQIMGDLETKDVLDTTTNTSAYTQSPVEFADLYLPGIIETFNLQANLFGQLPKRDHLMGGINYGWRLKSDQATSLSVDPDSVSIIKDPVNKVKVTTPIKEYRVGVSVSDYTLHHARASIGDLFQIEVQARMRDLMRDLNNDLFKENADGDGNQLLGLEAVADSAGNTTLYGFTRSVANRLAPDAAANTYQAIGGALTTAKVRDAYEKIEVDGAFIEDLRIIINPRQRSKLFELEDGNQRYGTPARLGFEGNISYDGITVIVDSSCQQDALFVVDFASEFIVLSRPPQVIGLAKVGAADEAYISVYLAHVYDKPRRIHMLDTLTT